MNFGKPFSISKCEVAEAYRKVKANKGSEGIDGITLEEFEKDQEDHFYKIWNRMASGTYFPPPVKAVDIPKANGGTRRLGIPTVSDRIAQQVVKTRLEPLIDRIFHADSFGYRPGKTMEQALSLTRQRCWKYNWVIDVDVKGFFDNMDHELVMKALKLHTNEKWILLYVERWLKAPMVLKEGTVVVREKGTPQGGVISPLLANLFMHYAFDKWMDKNYPSCPFERFADDVVIHCRTEQEAKELLENLKKRMEECKLELHPEKTKIVFCTDDNRRGDYPDVKFDFLGYTFKPRRCKTQKGKIFCGFNPGMSDKKKVVKREEMRKWKIHLWSGRTLEDIAKFVNPILRGWYNHYGKFHTSVCMNLLQGFNYYLNKWARKKYKRLQNSRRRANEWLGKVAMRQPNLFAHWKLGALPNGIIVRAV